MPAHARRPITSPTLKRLHEGRVYLRNNQDRRALFPRRCVSRSSTRFRHPLFESHCQPDNARLRIELQPHPLYGSLDSSDSSSCPRFRFVQDEGHFNEKGKKKLNQVRWSKGRIDRSSSRSTNLSILCCVSRAVHLRETMADRYGAVCGPTLYYSLPATPVFHKHVSIPHNRRKRFRKPRYVTVVEEADSMKSMRDTEYITGYIMHTFTRLDIFIAKRFTAVFPDTCLLITRSKYFTGRGRGLNLYDSKPIRRFWPSSLRKLA